MFENFNHYDEILRLKLLKKCSNIKNLNKSFNKMYNLSFKKINKISNDKEINYFYDLSKLDYPNELNKIVNNLIKIKL